jgi:predicted N-acetyltransferase YhbS
MGRLAVDQVFKGRGLGGALLTDSLNCAARAEIAAHALIVDAKAFFCTMVFWRCQSQRKRCSWLWQRCGWAEIGF